MCFTQQKPFRYVLAHWHREQANLFKRVCVCCRHGNLFVLLSDASKLECFDFVQAPETPLTFPVEFKLLRGDHGFDLETCFELAVRIFERDVGLDRIIVDQAVMCFMCACVCDWLFVGVRILTICTY